MPPASLSAAPVPAPPPPGPASLRVHPVAVFGEDERRPLKRSERKLEGQIGLLFNNGARTVCTAFCVDPRMIATAGHCIFRPGSTGPSPDLSGFWFTIDPGGRKSYSRIAGFRDGTALQNVMVDTTAIKVRPPIDATGDWAVIRLARPICEGRTLEVLSLSAQEIEEQSKAGKVFQAAFHRDFKEWELARSAACEVRREFEGLTQSAIARDFEHPQGLILHRCDTGEASSGSPILLDTDQGPAVIGVNVGSYVQSKVLMQNGQVTRRFEPETIANTAVNAAHLKPLIEALRDARIASSREDVLELQRRLRAAGLYAGALDGHFGELTRVAIRAYQKANGLPETGLPTDDIARHLVGPPPPERKQIDGSWVVPSGG
jgi:protease YdgD